MIPPFRFNPRQTGLETILGELERPIMEAVWAHPGTGVAEVMEQLASGVAYTTVKTVMERLERKGLLERQRHGKAYTYRATVSREVLEGQASRSVIEGLLDSFGSAAMTQFAAVVREDPERLAELRRLLESGEADP